ncbi:MAG TPA: hypothetical protein EYH19_01700 [Desulfocapsa sulfexigens]|nr:hypothetical protein [Desulfocapsa sulfexigens]
MINRKRDNKGYVFGLIVVALFALSGCLGGNTGSTAVPLSGDSFAPLSTPVGNFEDIELPAEMKHSNKSMSIRTDSFRGGIIYYKGRVEVHSLKDFIIASMKKNKWKLAGEVSSSHVVLAFTKPNKTCMMNIEANGPLSDTTLTMYVTVDVTASKTLNAFGESI